MNYPSKMDLMLAFKDGQELVLNTWHDVEGSFYCELYRRVTDLRGGQVNSSVSPKLEARSCKEAQEAAYSFARHQYPDAAERIKKPPYLIPPGSPGAVGPRRRRDHVRGK